MRQWFIDAKLGTRRALRWRTPHLSSCGGAPCPPSSFSWPRDATGEDGMIALRWIGENRARREEIVECCEQAFTLAWLATLGQSARAVRQWFIDAKLGTRRALRWRTPHLSSCGGLPS